MSIKDIKTQKHNVNFYVLNEEQKHNGWYEEFVLYTKFFI